MRRPLMRRPLMSDQGVSEPFDARVASVYVPYQRAGGFIKEAQQADTLAARLLAVAASKPGRTPLILTFSGNTDQSRSLNRNFNTSYGQKRDYSASWGLKPTRQALVVKTVMDKLKAAEDYIAKHPSRPLTEGAEQDKYDDAHALATVLAPRLKVVAVPTLGVSCPCRFKFWSRQAAAQTDVDQALDTIHQGLSSPSNPATLVSIVNEDSHAPSAQMADRIARFGGGVAAGNPAVAALVEHINARLLAFVREYGHHVVGSADVTPVTAREVGTVLTGMPLR